jgi:hypothetical protein
MNASLRSEQLGMGAVEMPPRAKRGKLNHRVSHSSHRAGKSGTRQPDSHISTAPGGGFIYLKRMRNEKGKPKFQLTDSVTSSTITTPASLRSENDRLHFGTSDRDQIGITYHLHRNKQRMVWSTFGTSNGLKKASK